ncbi:hypothetical protein BFG07_00890 [Kosakonia cowanii]|nr:hypothetical protein BFG07_00890 [Kosakonia cowanii]
MTSTRAVADVTAIAKAGDKGTAVNADRKVSFTADSSTAQVSTVALNGSEVSKLANGTDSFTYTVTVVDGNKNPVPGITVTPSADSKDVQVSTAAVTDASGHTTFTMTSTRAVADVTAIAKAGDKGTAVNADRKVSFTADSSTAQVSSFIVISDNAKDDGIDKDELVANVTDKYGNPVHDQKVNFSGPKDIILSATQSKTDEKGDANVGLTGKKSGKYEITASIGKSSLKAIATLTEETDSVKIANLKWRNKTSPALADDKDINVIEGDVVNKNGEFIKGAHIRISNVEGVNSESEVKTDDQGHFSIDLTSNVSGEFSTELILDNDNKSSIITGFLANSFDMQVDIK